MPIHPRGLDPETLYAIVGFDQPRSGKAWMETGLKVDIKNMQSKVLHIRKVTHV
jgi:hypothetical protein